MKSSLTFTILKTTLGAGLLAMTASLAPAAEVYFDTISTEKASRLSGAYFGVFGGSDFDQDADVNPGDAGPSFTLDGQGSLFLGVEFGYEWQTPFPLRTGFEVEAMYLSNDFEAHNEFSEISADFHSAVIMANLTLALDLADYRDDVGPFWAAFHPYIGAGFGGAYTWQRNGKIKDLTDGSEISNGNSGDFTFAYQLFAGVEFDLTDTLSLYAEYKYLVFDDLGTSSGISDYQHNLFGAGLKMQY